MKYEEIESKFDSYFKFEAQRSFVTPEAAKFFAQHIATQVEERADKLRAAICQTLDDNSHLADGEVCTLHKLKVALRETGSPWAGEVQAELDALNERIEKLKGWTDNQIPKAKKSALRGFGTTITVGGARNWYVGTDGVKRWADDQIACGK